MWAALSVALFAGAFLAPFAVWRWRSRGWGLPVRVTVDPEDPRPDAIGGYLAEIARRMDERPERMRIVFDGRNRAGRAIRLDVEGDGALRVFVDGCRPRRVDLRGRWIADHPVPLALDRAVVYVEPVDANRFRVMPDVPFTVPAWVYALCSLAATLGLVLLRIEVLAAVAGLLLGVGARARWSRLAARCRSV